MSFEIFLTDISTRDAARVADLTAVEDPREANRICITLRRYLREGIEAHFVSAGDAEFATGETP